MDEGEVTIVLIDLSGIVHAQFHVSGTDPNPDATSIAAVAKVRALASGQPHVAVCTEGGRSFRRDVSPDYKANRPEHQAALMHQMQVTIDTLRADGFPIWSAPGFEADDVIASAVTVLGNGDETANVLVCSSDKDLLQLVGPHVQVKRLTDGSLYNVDAVKQKYGVTPEQFRDYLCLVGDSSDNVKGANGIGEKKAAAMLQKYGTIEAIYDALGKHGTQFTPSTATALREFETRLPVVRELITLRTDLPVPFADVFKERMPDDVATFGDETVIEEAQCPLPEAPPASSAPSAAPPESIPSVPNGGETRDAPSTPALPGAGNSAGSEREKPDAATVGNRGTSLVRQAEVVRTDFQLSDGPQTYAQAKLMAADIHSGRLFSAYGSPAAVLTTIMAGHELGLTPMAALRGFHIIDGKPCMAADLIRARVLSYDQCEYFRCTERTATAATFITKRKGEDEIALRYTVEEGKIAFGDRGEKAWLASGWGKNPADMCVARASSKLARLVYPERVHGYYAPEEME